MISSSGTPYPRSSQAASDPQHRAARLSGSCQLGAGDADDNGRMVTVEYATGKGLCSRALGAGVTEHFPSRIGRSHHQDGIRDLPSTAIEPAVRSSGLEPRRPPRPVGPRNSSINSLPQPARPLHAGEETTAVPGRIRQGGGAATSVSSRSWSAALSNSNGGDHPAAGRIDARHGVVAAAGHPYGLRADHGAALRGRRGRADRPSPVLPQGRPVGLHHSGGAGGR